MKKLGTVQICGKAFEVREGDYSDFQPLEKAYGVCDSANQHIWIHANMPPGKVQETLAHEILHALLNSSGAIHATGAALGVGEDDAKLEAWEEMFVRVLAPHVMVAFIPNLVSSNARNRK